MCVVGKTAENCSECSGTAWNKCVGHYHVCRVSEKCVSAAAVLTQGITVLIYFMCMCLYDCWFGMDLTCTSMLVDVVCVHTACLRRHANVVFIL